MAREIGYPTGEILALSALSFAARSRDDIDHAVQLARQAAQITAGVPGVCVRWCSYVLTGALILAGDLAGADDVCAAGLARSRDAGDVFNQWSLLPHMVFLDVHAGRFEHAAAHLREGLQIAVRTGGWFELSSLPGWLRIPVRRDRAARRGPHDVGRECRAPRARQTCACETCRCAPPARRSEPTGPVPRRTAARR